MAKGRLQDGFSLVELMAAVAIMAMLVSLALPRYRAFIARARTSEAKTNLGLIYGLQQTYKAEFEKYGELKGVGYTGNCNPNEDELQNELGFRVTDCLALRYNYTSDSGSAEAKSNGSEIYPTCTDADEWSISEERKLDHGESAIKTCSS